MSCMDEKIRNRLKNAYDGVVLDEELRREGKKELLAKARRGRKKFPYGAAAVVAAALVLAIGNIWLIRLNMNHGENVPAAESTFSGEQTESGSVAAVVGLDDIENLSELEDFAWTPNSCVWEMENNFYVAVLCYDENGADCLPKSNLTARIEYAYFLFDESGAKITQYRESFRIEDGAWIKIGAVYLDGDWYEVRDRQNNNGTHIYEIYNITSPWKSNYARYLEDEENVALIRENTYYFAQYAEQGNGYMTVGILENEDYGQISGLEQINSRQDIENLMAQPDTYSLKLREDMYLVALAYLDNTRCGGDEKADRIDIGCYVTENDEIAARNEWSFDTDNSDMEYIGASNYDGSYYLIGKEKGSERYIIRGLFWDYEERLYRDEGICSDVYSNAQFFAGLVTEPGGVYWQVGGNMLPQTDYSPESYCESHDWNDRCTSDMTVRDIYVTRNWIGGSALKFIGLERFFGELVQTQFETGDETGMVSAEYAYQVNQYYECAGFTVSTEPDSDEIISVTLYGNHNYVTEDVWLGMSMADVKKNMGIDDSAFFEKDGYMYSFFEKDDYLYEFSYVKEPEVGNLSEYVLSFSRISDAAKIKTSPVKSFGELMEEGKSIFAQ